jgi:UPF0755 protein
MPKFWIAVALAVFACFTNLLRVSHFEDHSILLMEGDDIAVVIDRDGAYGRLSKHWPDAFILSAVFKLTKPKAGEYVIHRNEAMLSVIRRIIAHDCLTRKMTFPEGVTVQMVLESLDENKLLTGRVERIPEEGTLAPDTYFYRFMDTRNSIIKKMEIQMKSIILQIKNSNKTNLSTSDVIILASIIEKETGIDRERRLISSIFHNRLNKKMRLQSCPTVIYAISNGCGRIGRKLTRSDLWFESPFNTYRHAGLPPTAICCPGTRSIYASMNPAKTEYMYFVANSDGVTHSFSKSFDEHRSAKDKIGKKRNS